MRRPNKEQYISILCTCTVPTHEKSNAMSTYFTLIHVVNHEIHNSTMFHSNSCIYKYLCEAHSKKMAIVKMIRSAFIFPYHFGASQRTHTHERKYEHIEHTANSA